MQHLLIHPALRKQWEEAPPEPLISFWDVPGLLLLWCLRRWIRALYWFGAVVYAAAKATDYWLVEFMSTFHQCNRSPANEIEGGMD